MNVAEAIVKYLETEGVDKVFGCPGGAILPLYEALRKSDIDHVLVRNEQSGAHCASGYARASGRLGVCISTSGPGATNMITGIATAYSDSIPMIVITGQVRTHLIGMDVFQEADVVGSTEPFTKFNFLVKTPEDIGRVMAKAIKIATTGRPGPVLIDIPRDVLESKVQFEENISVELEGYKPVIHGHAGQIKRMVKLLKASKRPVVFAGGGVVLSGAKEALTQFAEFNGIPVLNTFMGIGSFPMESENFAGIVGYHGNNHCDEILMRSDLIIIIGARISDRASKNFSTIKSNIDIVHIDIDPAEIGKIVDNKVPIVGDAHSVLTEVNNIVKPNPRKEWMKLVKEVKSNPVALNLEPSDYVNPKTALRLLSKLTPKETIVTADVGQNQIWAARNFEYTKSRQYFTSGGLGTMGYSLPAAIGAKLACQDKAVVAVMGDGGIQMLLGELGTLAEIDHPVIVLLFHNNLLGMVRELQDNSYGKHSRYGIQYTIRPDFVQIGAGYGIKGIHVSSNCELERAFREALDSNQSYIIECNVDPKFNSV